jgi:hypothetical protein
MTLKASQKFTKRKVVILITILLGSLDLVAINGWF